MSADPNTDNNVNRVPVLKPCEKLNKKFDLVKSLFLQHYGRKPKFFVRVPGRVNIIGEHVDYCGYSVCPMAIKQNVLLAVDTSPESGLRLTNTNSCYTDFCIEDLNDIRNKSLDQNEGNDPTWYKYFLCGVKGALEIVSPETLPKGLDVVVSGSIIPSAGLSSSSALVCAALLALVHASKNKLFKKELAIACAKAERYIGTQGGGMDQAIAFLAEPGMAKLISFNPLQTTDVTLPANGVFVIAHSLAQHNKASTYDFNLRVIECRLAAQIIAKKRKKEWQRIEKLVDIQKMLGKSLEEMTSIVMSDLSREAYTLKEVSEILEVSPDLLKTISGISFEINHKLMLRQRALHVFQEACRVFNFQSICQQNDLSEGDRIKLLGDLMNESHKSLKFLYECSHPELDKLVDTFLQNGASGARLTGAGWGGCVVTLVSNDQVDKLLESVGDTFYQGKNIPDDMDLRQFIFKTEPKTGAEIFVAE